MMVDMAKPPKKPKLEDIETEPGAEERFERTVRNMLKTPPRQHQEDVGKASGKRSSQAGAPVKGKAKQKQSEVVPEYRTGS